MHELQRPRASSKSSIEFALVAALVFAPGSPAVASDGLADISWNACSPVVRDVTTQTPGPYTLYVSVTGFDQAHLAYESTLIYGDATGSVPDAWRFDPAGCQGSSFITIDHKPSREDAKTCPPFDGGGIPWALVKDVSFIPPGDQGTEFLATMMRVSFFCAYPPGIANPDPAKRYFLVSVLFDHSYSVAGTAPSTLYCGGWETPMCIKVLRLNYLAMADSTEHAFGRNVAPGVPMHLTFNAGGGSVGCDVVPARPMTWGELKHQYR